jgi:hypothetical protein
VKKSRNKGSFGLIQNHLVDMSLPLSLIPVSLLMAFSSGSEKMNNTAWQA